MSEDGTKLRKKTKTSEAFAFDVKSIRQSQGLTQSEFAYLLGVEQATISRWENGKSDPTYDSVRSIMNFAKNAKIDVNKLQTFKDEDPKETDRNIAITKYSIPITDFADKNSFKLSKFDAEMGMVVQSPLDAGLTTVGFAAYLPFFRSNYVNEQSASVLLYNNDRSLFKDKISGVLSVVCLESGDIYFGKLFVSSKERFHLMLPNGQTLQSQAIRWAERITHVLP